MSISFSRPMLLLASLVLTAPVSAHTVWLVPEKGQTGQWHVLFGGHAGQLNTYPASKLKEVRALAPNGKILPLRRTVADDGVHLKIDGTPSVILAHYDNGIHTVRSNGPSVEKPMNQVPNAIKATRAIKWHKTIANWAPNATTVYNQPFELIPLSASQPVAGQPMKLRVLINGKPAPGIEISRNEEGNGTYTDAQGIASFTPQKGFNKIWSGKRSPVKGNPAYTEESIEYSLGFFAR